MTIPKRHLRAYEAAAESGWGFAVEALAAHKARKVRVAVKAKPRKEAAKLTKDARRARTTEVRGIVFARAAGKCECCGVATPSELHHVLGGPDRMAKEHPRTCAALCYPCHLAIHRSQMQALNYLLRWAGRNDFTTASSAIQRRIRKLETA